MIRACQVLIAFGALWFAERIASGLLQAASF